MDENEDHCLKQLLVFKLSCMNLSVSPWYYWYFFSRVNRLQRTKM